MMQKRMLTCVLLLCVSRPQPLLDLRHSQTFRFPRPSAPQLDRFSAACSACLCTCTTTTLTSSIRLARHVVNESLPIVGRLTLFYQQEAHVNTCYKHFYYFVQEFKLIDPKELEPLVCACVWGMLHDLLVILYFSVVRASLSRIDICGCWSAEGPDQAAVRLTHLRSCSFGSKFVQSVCEHGCRAWLFVRVVTQRSKQVDGWMDGWMGG